MAPPTALTIFPTMTTPRPFVPEITLDYHGPEKTSRCSPRLRVAVCLRGPQSICTLTHSPRVFRNRTGARLAHGTQAPEGQTCHRCRSLAAPPPPGLSRANAALNTLAQVQGRHNAAQPTPSLAHADPTTPMLGIQHLPDTTHLRHITPLINALPPVSE